MIRRTARTPERALRPARKRSSILLVLGILGVSVFGGAASPVAAVPPSGPPDLSALQAFYPDNTPPSFAVTTTDSDTVIRVTWTAVDGGATVADFCPNAQTFSGNTATCTGAAVPVPGVYDVTATSSLLSDPASSSAVAGPVSVEVYGVAPGDFVTGPDLSSSDATPTWTGTGPARGTVEVREGITILCSATVLADGTWACTATVGLGAHTGINLRAVDRSSAVTNDTSPDFTVNALFDGGLTEVDGDTTPPWITSLPEPEIVGNKDVNAASIVVEVGPTTTGPWLPYCSIVGIAGVGTWSCLEPTNPLQAGDNFLRVSSFNENGDPSPNQLQFLVRLVAAPVITSPADGAEVSDTTPTFAGTAEGTSVDVYFRGESIQLLCTSPVVAGAWSCDSTPLDQGFYEVYAAATPGQFVESPSTFIFIDSIAPAAPAVTNGGVTTTDRSPTITGTGESGTTITGLLNGAPVACVGGAPQVGLDGTWSCQLAQSLGIDSYSVTSRQTDSAGNVSPLSAAVTLTIRATAVAPAARPAPSATPTPTATPTPSPTPFRWKLDGNTPGEVQPGDRVTLSASNLPPGLTVSAEFHSTVVELGSTTVRADGTFSLPVTVPDNATAGLHHFVVTVWAPTGEAVVVEQAVTVTPVAKTLSAILGGHAAALSQGGSSADRSDPGAPSGMTHSIHGVGFLVENPLVLCLAAVAALALFLLVAFPAELLNSTISEQYSRFSRVLPSTRGLQRVREWFAGMPLVGGLLIIISASIIFGFADPNFGFDITSFRLVLSCVLALFVVAYLSSVISGRILGGKWKLDTTIELKPLGLLLTVAGVVISRLLDFTPGFLLGLILGLSLVGTTTAGQRAKATLVSAGVVFGIAITGWLVYSALSSTLNPDDFGTALLFDALVIITAEGLTAVFIGMLPLKFLDGPAVFQYSKKLWVAAFLVSAFAFVAIVIPAAWGELNGSIGVWASIVAAFAVVSVGIYLYFRFWARPVAPETEESPGVTEGNRASRVG